MCAISLVECKIQNVWVQFRGLLPGNSTRAAWKFVSVMCKQKASGAMGNIYLCINAAAHNQENSLHLANFTCIHFIRHFQVPAVISEFVLQTLITLYLLTKGVFGWSGKWSFYVSALRFITYFIKYARTVTTFMFRIIL